MRGKRQGAEYVHAGAFAPTEKREGERGEGTAGDGRQLPYKLLGSESHGRSLESNDSTIRHASECPSTSWHTKTALDARSREVAHAHLEQELE